MIVVVPAPTAVARPDPLIVATVVADDNQATLAVSVLPAEFFAVALNDIVAPTVMVGEGGDTDTVVTVVVSVPVPPPEPVRETGLVRPTIRPSLVSQAPSVMTSTADVANMAVCRIATKGTCIMDYATS